MEKRGFKKQTVIIGLIVATWLCVTLFGIQLFGLHDGWPAFLVLLFFFETGAKVEKLKNIFCGGAVGILLALGFFLGVEFLEPMMGLGTAIFAMVFLIVFLIIVLGDISHTLFNNYAFCYFTVSLIYSEQATLEWLLVLFLGGAFFIGGVWFLMKQILFKQKKDEKAEKPHTAA